jgi:hypothetical protein
MRKLLLGSIALCIFAISITLVQVSCSKSNANPLDQPQLGKIVYETGDKIWIANYDGTNANPIPIVLPTNIRLCFNTPATSLTTSPDGQTIFFSCTNTSYSNYTAELYSCSINGGNATLVIAIPAGMSSTEYVGHAHAF